MEETSLFIVLSVLALGSSYCYYRLQKMTPQGSRFRKLKKPVWWLAAFNILLLAISHVAGYPKALQILFYIGLTAGFVCILATAKHPKPRKVIEKVVEVAATVAFMLLIWFAKAMVSSRSSYGGGNNDNPYSFEKQDEDDWMMNRIDNYGKWRDN